MKTLYVSFSKRGIHYAHDASARYRCIYQAIKQRCEGNLADVIHYSDIKKIDLLDYDQIVFHRPRASRTLKKVLKNLRSSRTLAIADYDDLLFRPDLAGCSPTVLMQKESARFARQQAKDALKALRLFNHCQMSTLALIDKAQDVHIACEYRLIVNQVPDYERPTTHTKPEERFTGKIIRYLPGTSNHATNLEVIETVLTRFLTENPDCRLEITGDIDLGEAMKQHPQISQHPFLPYQELGKQIDTSWITIAPLQNNPFNYCKSALKFWESGIYGVPVIATPNSDTRRMSNPGLMQPETPEEWSMAIQSMTDKVKYYEAAEQARLHAESAYFSATCQQWETRPGIPSLNQVLPHRQNEHRKLNPTLRKVRKLLRSPAAFFRDARKNKIKAKSIKH